MMKLPISLVCAVLIYSTARYLPPYYLEMRKMDLEAEKLALQKTQISALLQEIHSQSENRGAPKTKAGVSVEKKFW